jgi:hypothetical protein
MRYIPLSQGKLAIVDDADFPLISHFKWCYRGERNGQDGYAIRHARADGKVSTRYLHRELMEPKPGQEVIFLNYDRLDCRRENLLAVSKEEARQHHRVRSNSKSGIKGVKYNPDGNSWSAYKIRDRRCYHLGTFTTKEAAQAAYEAGMKNENLKLHTAPERVDRSNMGQVQHDGTNTPSLSA